jgi:type VI secretion system protein ImpL
MNFAWSTWLILALLLLLLAVALFAWLRWRRRAAGAAPPIAPQLSRRGFAAAISALYPPGQRSGRYDQPCLLVVGTAGSGKSALLAAAGLQALPGTGGVPSGWWQSLDGTAFEVPDQAWGDDDHAWHRCLRLFERHRPRRPFDALLWVVPLASLAGGETVLAALATQAERKFDALQRRLGLQVPLYLAISCGDSLPGFGALAAAMPPAVQAQCLGWNNPYAPGMAYQPAWAEQGLGQLCARLRVLVSELRQASLQAQDAAASGDLFLLPERTADALRPLPQLLERALRRHAQLPAPDLRGIYLCGQAQALAAATAAVAPEPDPFGPEPAAVRPLAEPVFCRDLLNQRIFAEFGLAQPGRRQLAGAGRPQQMVLAGGIVISLAWLAALPYAYRDARDKARSMHAPLALAQKAITARRLNDKDSSARFAQHYLAGGTAEVLAAIDRVPEWPLRTPLLPLSWDWNAGVDYQTRGVLRHYFEDVVLDDIGAALLQRAAELVATRAATPASHAPAKADQTAEFAALSAFVDDTLQLEAQRQKYERLGTYGDGNWNDVAACSITCSS